VILVIAEQRDGKLNRASWEAVAAAQLLSGGDMPVKVAVLGRGVDAIAGELGPAVAEVLIADSDALATYTPDGFVAAASTLIAAQAPQYVLLAHTYQARDFVPTLASRLDRALVTDVIGIRTVDGHKAFARPMFQGKLVADVVPQGPAPWLVTLQIGAFRADSVQRPQARTDSVAGAAPNGLTTRVVMNLDAAAIRQRPEPPFQEAKQAVDLSQAERIVAVGRGIKSQENVAVAEQLAQAFGAELAASRPICDNGWLPMERQIGSSGQTVAPKLYVAVGISGAIQHLVGMKGARTIVAINKDAEAPIFEIADYGIVGDLFEVAPALIAELKK
jgi:electron transfer flavoprotein alpha subunit